MHILIVCHVILSQFANATACVLLLFKMSAPYYYAACYLYSITVSHDGLSDIYFSQKLHSLFRLK